MDETWKLIDNDPKHNRFWIRGTAWFNLLKEIYLNKAGVFKSM